MAQSFSLVSQVRTTFGKEVKHLRLKGSIPAVAYGRGATTDHIELSTKDFIKVYQKAGSNTIVDLDIAGKPVKTIIYHVDYHPVTDVPRHVDFFKIRMDEKLTTQVPLTFVGESPTVRAEGAIVVHIKDHVEIRCLPADLPHEIQVDVSVMAQVNDSIHVKDLPIPANVEILDGLEDMVAQAIIPKEIKIEVVAPVIAAIPGAEGAVPGAEGAVPGAEGAVPAEGAVAPGAEGKAAAPGKEEKKGK